MKDSNQPHIHSVAIRNGSNTSTLVLLAALLFFAVLAAPSALAANITKASTGTDVTAGASWAGAVAPGTGDVATWDTGSLGAGLTLNSGTPSWLGIKGNAGATDPIVIGSGGTLTLGNSGLDLSGATINATISSGLTLGTGNQLWNLKAGSGRTLTVNGAFTRNTGSTLMITTNATSGIGTVTFSPTLVNGLVPWAIMTNSGTAANNSALGYTFATTSGGNVVAYLAATPETTTASAWGGIPSGGTGLVNYDISIAGTPGVTGLNRNVNTLRYTGSGWTQNGNTAAILMNANAILNAGSGTLTIGGSGTAIGVSSSSTALNELILTAANAPITMGGVCFIANNGANVTTLTANGPNVVTLAGASTFTGNVNVNSGTLVVNRANNSLNPVTSALGNPQVARNINVNRGGTLQFLLGDSLGGANSTVVATLVVNAGGVVTNNNNNFNTLGAVQLNGGTITGAGGAVAGYQMYNLRGSVTVGGSSMSTLAGTGAFSGYHLGAPTTFTVNDVTAGTDLLVSGILVDRNATDGGPGSLTKTGAGTMTLSGASTFVGDTTINTGTLALTGSGSLASTNVYVNSPGIFDVSGVTGGYTLASGHNILGNGNVNGSLVPADASSSIYPGTFGTVATLTFNNNVNLTAGGSVYFDASTTAASGNDQVIVSGNLTLTSATKIHVNALSGAANLDTTADYVLFAVTGTTTIISSPTLIWDGTTPGNYLNYTVTTSGNNVVLHYVTATAPTVTAVTDSASYTRNQPVTMTATVTPGSGNIVSVIVDLTQIGGSSTASLVLSGVANVYTNTFPVAYTTSVGGKTLLVTVTDDTTPTPLSGTFNLGLTVVAGSGTWDGGSLAGNNWTDNVNWQNDTGPGLTGDSLTFAGTTRLTPNLDANYVVSGLTFDATAGSFNLGSTGGNVLGLSAGTGIVNNSPNAQIVNVPLTMSAAQTLDAEGNSMTFSQNITNGGSLVTVTGPANTAISGQISGGGGLTMTGSAVLTLTGVNTFTGNVFADNGTVVVSSGGVINNGGNYSSIGRLGSDNAILTLMGTGAFTNAADFNVGDIGAAVGTLNVQDSAVLNVGQLFIASANAAGSTASGTVNQIGGSVIENNGGVGFFVIGGRNSASALGVGSYNISGGTLTAAAGIRVGSYGTGTMTVTNTAVVNANGGFNIARLAGSVGTLNLDGGTVTTVNITSSTGVNCTNNFNGAVVRPTTANTWVSGLTQCNVRNGGAILDTTNLNVTISQALSHSVITGDNATDGGLTKLGSSTLTLSGANTYTGNTTVSNGTLFVSGSLGTGAVTVNGGTLAGNGTIGGAVTVNSTGTLAPQSSGSGALTISGNLALNAGSTNTFAVNGSTLANDTVAAGGTVAYGGLLNVVTNGSFTLGQTFTLFSGAGAASASNFSSIVGNPGGGLLFSFTNGVLSVVNAGPTGQATITNSVSGNTLSLTWPTGQGWRLVSQTNSLSTGLTTGSGAWNTVPGVSDGSATITIDPTLPTVFYRLVYP